jgi:acetate kinase
VRVLVVNAGSSSLKLRLLGPGDELAAEHDPPPADGEALEAALAELSAPDAVGHRVVHGGARFRDAVLVDDDVVAALGELADLAPLHQPAALAGIAAVGRALPGVPAVACFDTAFHATLPAAAATYALPREWRERFGLRRFGFHGLSHAYASRRAAAPRVVSCHLGAGASLAAVRDGVCVDTTMGFTPMEGLVMATRAGSVDPGLVLWLLRHGLDADALERGLDREGGVRGLAGEADMRAVLARDDDDARLALDVYLHRLRAGIAAMAAALGGLDALVFTGGVGEHAPEVRARTAAGLGFLGVALDPEANAHATADAEIGAPGAAARALVVTAREDLEVARQVRARLAADP